MMAITPVAIALGLGIAAWLLRATTDMFDHQVFERTNYRGHRLPTAVGVVFALVLVMAAAASQVVGQLLAELDLTVASDALELSVRIATVSVVVVPFVLLGLIDDLVGVGQSGGFKGHLAGLFRGEFTSGSIKMMGGACVGMLGAIAYRSYGFVDIIRDGALLALWANVGNLFDRAPGRSSKVCLSFCVAAAGVGFVVNGARVDLGVAVILGAALALLLPDLAERFMLGDAGSNVLGVVVGVTVLTSFGAVGRWCGLGLAIALNLASEFVSFSRVIEKNGLLRYLDLAGARNRPR